MQSLLDFSGPIDSGESCRFHPAVESWLARRFGQPTEVQTRAWAVTSQHRNALIAAPTGSGKTLAAFLAAINDLVVEGLSRELRNEVYVLYVSPLKALSNDIQKNLQEPLQGIRQRLLELGYPDVPIADGLRTGDTPQAERERQRRSPPQILVTTPESLYLLLSSERGRQMFGALRTVIVDELHALAGTKRGSHLMLSLERLEALVGYAPTRIGLSATVKPLSDMAGYLVGDLLEHAAGPGQPGEEAATTTALPALASKRSPAVIVDTGHVRARDIAMELPASPLTAVMANEVWGEIYDRLATLVGEHRTTLIFVNQRRLAERAARHLADRLGEEHVAAHHGSLSREHRLQAEQRLKAGQLRALIATSSLELGIDIGDVDLVCQLGSPRSINAFLQRVGRAGHAIGALPKGRLFPLSLDDLLESSALLNAVEHGELDRIIVPPKPLDALAQQIVAEAACQEWPVDALHAVYRRAAPYRDLSLGEFEALVQMLSDGYATRRGRRGAHLHYDAVNRIIRGRRGARLTAVTNGGVIPDQFDADVILLPEGQRIGSIGEDFAFESIPGDIFQLGNSSYRILKVEVGKVLVEDAHGLPPSVPFWFGDALGRTDELSASVRELLDTASDKLAEGTDVCLDWLRQTLKLPEAAATQLGDYLAASWLALGALPGNNTVIFERFFDDVGDAHFVIHSPYGSRLNKAWGLALRKRFCRQFNFELQASALEDSVILSLGPTHSFPLDEPSRYLKSSNAREVLIQALLDAPMFGTRWRWVATAALAVRRMNGGKRVPPQFQRSDAEDLLTVVFPDQVACLENITGPREVPDHPLVQQTIADCLSDTMDIAGLEHLLHRMEAGELRVHCADLTAPSPLSLAIINARPYAFLDDGEAEERRTRSISTGGTLELADAKNLARLDPDAIARVLAEARPEPANADELHDAMLSFGWLMPGDLGMLAGSTESDPPAAVLPSPPGRGAGGEGVTERGLAGSPAPSPRPETPSSAPAGHLLPHREGNAALAQLHRQQRATQLYAGSGTIHVAAERLHELCAVLPQAAMHPAIRPVRSEMPDPADALRELIRNRMELLGPTREQQLADELGIADTQVHLAMLALEGEGAMVRGHFTHPDADEWCDRRLLARMHRYSRDRRRAEYRPVAPAQFLRFLFRWHGLDLSDGAMDERRQGENALLAALQQLEGYAAPAAGWEEELLPARIRDYRPQMLDRLCGSGHIVWARPPVAASSGNDEGPRRRGGPIRSTPIWLCEREGLMHWQRQAGEREDVAVSSRAQKIVEALREHGASFQAELIEDCRLLPAEFEDALGELVSAGLITCDSYAGLRALVMPAEKRERIRRRLGRSAGRLDDTGRWSLIRNRRRPADDEHHGLGAPEVEHIAMTLLRRYGVVFRKLLEREDNLPPWRELHYIYRRLEARGEIRGGRFVSGFAGEQFALPEAATLLYKLPQPGNVERVTVSAVDPLNLVGILTPGEKLARLPGNRVLFENGVAVAVQAGGDVRFLRDGSPETLWQMREALVRRSQNGSGSGGLITPSFRRH